MADVGMNLAPVQYWGTEFPFIDRMKTSGGWSAYGLPMSLDAQGNPTAIPTGSSLVQALVALDPVSAPMTDIYELTYGGTAAFQVPGAKVVSSQPGKLVFQWTNAANSQANIVIRSVSTSDPVHDIHIVRQDQVAAFDHGQIFNPDFLAQVSNWQTLRFMDWGNINNTNITSWEQRSHVTDATWADNGGSPGVPIEVMVQLSNEARTDMWFNIPTRADDAYVRNALQMIKDRLAPGLQVHVEYSNEVWNFGFQQSKYALKMANELWGRDANHDGLIDPNNTAEAVQGGWQIFYGYRSAQIASIANSVFSGVDNNRLDMVLATQNGNAGLEQYVFDGVRRADAGSVGSLFDEWSVTSYFGLELSGFSASDRATVLSWARSGDAGLSAAFQELAHGGAGFSVPYSIDEVAKFLRYEKTAADRYGLDLVGYEGGFHGLSLNYGADQATVMDFYARLMADPRMEELYKYWFDTFSDAGGAMLAAYYDVRQPSNAGTFGTLNSLYDAKTPRYNALLSEAAPKDLLGYIADNTQILSDLSSTLSTVDNGSSGDPLGEAHTAATIDQLYRDYGGRDPLPWEADIWKANIRGGMSLAQMRTIILDDPLGQTHSAQVIDQLYREYGGRAPFANEIPIWKSIIRGGESFDQMRRDILDNPLGQSHTASAVNAMYQILAGRAPTTQELSIADTALHGGSTFADLRTALLADSTINAHVVAAITQQYQDFGGRAPQAYEIDIWKANIANGMDFATMRSIILSDPLGKPYLDGQITQAYQTWAGRVPIGNEVAIWESILRGQNYDFTVIRNGILGDQLGQTHTAQVVDQLYHEYAGRAAQPFEINIWKANIQNGADFATVRNTILDNLLGQTHTTGAVSQSYQTVVGRAPSSQEYLDADTALHGGATFATLRANLLAVPANTAHVEAAITQLYVDYGGRAPQAYEIDIWKANIGNGMDFPTMRTIILDDQLGQTHSAAAITQLYTQYFGRAPAGYEIDIWKSGIRGGVTFGQLADTLLTDGNSAPTTRHVAGTSGTDTFHFDTLLKNLTVTGFDPAHDVIDLQGQGFGTFDPLDAAHAHRVATVDSMTDTLITVDADHSILIKGVALASLSDSDFLI